MNEIYELVWMVKAYIILGFISYGVLFAGGIYFIVDFIRAAKRSKEVDRDTAL